MIILGIDYGEQNIGLALASGPLAEPLENMKFSPKTYSKIGQIVKRLGVEKVIIGMPEGKIEKSVKVFAEKLALEIQTPIAFQDETLSTKIAMKKLYEAKAKKKKRLGALHSYAAALILQDYLDQCKCCN